MSSIRPPDSWKGKFVTTLQVLLFVRERILAGVALEMFIGKLDINLFAAFIDGMQFHLYCSGIEDEEYQAFGAWLRDVCKEFPSPGGWEQKYLADTGGDHRAAILKFLDRCADFVEKREETTY